MIELPKSCNVNRAIPKKLFYEKMKISKTLKNDFITLIDKITWLYKLSEETIGITKSEDVEEIQIFEINLKTKKYPTSIIREICKAIPYKILFIIKYREEYCYCIKVEELYFTEWNENIDFSFTGHNLKTVYETLVKTIIKEKHNNNEFEKLIDRKNQIDELKTEQRQLNNKIKLEKQFNRKVELNRKLKKIEQKLKSLLDNQEDEKYE